MSRTVPQAGGEMDIFWGSKIGEGAMMASRRQSGSQGNSDGRRPPRLVGLVLLVLAGAGGLVACGDQGTPPPPEAPRTAASTSPQTAQTTPSPIESAAPSASVGEPGPSDAPPTTDFTPVNPDDYRVELAGAYLGWTFTSPDGAFRCGISKDLVGCQATVLVAGMDQCGLEPTMKAAMVGWYPPNLAVGADCTTQGLFPAGLALPVGSSLTGDGTTCQSEVGAITCRPESGGGFVISTQGIAGLR